MKRIDRIALAVFSLFMLPAIVISAQGKEKEKHVKIVIADKAGTKVEIDTLIKGDKLTDSIRLKNGEVIYIASTAKHGKAMHSEGGSETMFVTYSSDDNDNKEKHKKVIVITGDSDSSKIYEKGDVIIINGGKHLETVGEGSISVVSSNGNDTQGSKHVYIKGGKNSGNKTEKTVEVTVTSDDKSNNVEKSKYVIAKDGMVVTVEGNDEVKAKEIINFAKSKLGVNKDDKDSREITKETKKTGKK